MRKNPVAPADGLAAAGQASGMVSRKRDDVVGVRHRPPPESRRLAVRDASNRDEQSENRTIADNGVHSPTSGLVRSRAHSACGLQFYTTQLSSYRNPRLLKWLRKLNRRKRREPCFSKRFPASQKPRRSGTFGFDAAPTGLWFLAVRSLQMCRPDGA